MEPITLTILGAGALLVGWAIHRKDTATPESAQTGVSQTIKGKSGHTWLLQATTAVNAAAIGSIYVDVAAGPGEYGSLQATFMPVIKYMQIGSDVSSRTLLSKYPGAPPQAYADAISDFGVKSA